MRTLRSKRRRTARRTARRTQIRNTRRNARRNTRRVQRRVTRRVQRRVTRRVQIGGSPTKNTSGSKRKFFIFTYKDNIPFAKETKRLLKKEWDITGKVIEGYKVGDKYQEKKLKKNEVVMAGFKEKLLPKMK